MEVEEEKEEGEEEKEEEEGGCHWAGPKHLSLFLISIENPM